MQSKAEVLNRIKSTGVVAVIRAERPDDLIDVSRALVQGGVCCVEITLTVPGAIRVIEKASSALGDDVAIGVGTVLDAETARAAILAGAGFVVSPAFRPAVVGVCRRYSIACMPGAMTPTEILAAWEAGADVVKVFPAGVGGAQYFKDIKGPFPEIELMPTGAVTLETAPQFIKAGACAVGVGGELAGKAVIAARDFERMSRTARAFIEAVRKARGIEGQ
ncbi:MAG: bifunctional 4-hydroxy-2-oxoglutarate aldolase/2-dehydro-3-deoxy-phosphogluconate aldolase [Verrucomicrobia bacterium]|jgi:2-dehydro-3-deoxyphosphogluconate aldolase/(4S)-4-hydroxy-2-oxoglutarate aldolase|nr:bifunctional 4-hydroxy-2-oxoglutarate aldolase/2-dehydro-3-deoxy-phosphogluconate aldolase [Verrucomicrobiota bacterium]OQC63572.1 MAG: KHG/KDPG aldolase [Verrucomicrobia bacterium ADurb.Bin006]MDI9381003.1 bifunctional 4-hydroxy-2-oxoglutarate aldolase/2-dehydro-3-deoxy-phosphogluconate aldolase [Verrucomicrobiota bacterium]NMD19123.1 bifunctional 4-hydroxy-2-oxoglutarate aldolase/2-dehydro-3-deoxy-phosphogluconate aldolase [Verrucomicrobiota bacterium]HOA60450.1 bifunctional 4-hydroxy-2-ox